MIAARRVTDRAERYRAQDNVTGPEREMNNGILVLGNWAMYGRNPGGTGGADGASAMQRDGLEEWTKEELIETVRVLRWEAAALILGFLEIQKEKPGGSRRQALTEAVDETHNFNVQPIVTAAEALC